MYYKFILKGFVLILALSVYGHANEVENHTKSKKTTMDAAFVVGIWNYQSSHLHGWGH